MQKFGFIKFIENLIILFDTYDKKKKRRRKRRNKNFVPRVDLNGYLATGAAANEANGPVRRRTLSRRI